MGLDCSQKRPGVVCGKLSSPPPHAPCADAPPPLGIALWRFRVRQRSARSCRLQCCNLVPELHCLHRRCLCFPDHLCSPRRHQDSYPEQVTSSVPVWYVGIREKYADLLSRNFENPESGFRIISNMARNEGLTSFFKGLTPKLLMTGPKLVFSFWLAQTLIPIFDKKLYV